ncbi:MULTISPECIES: hypothetical protein [Bacillus cereus group]|uniref:Uncharacterized protein n=1 Tax=Bacillus cereus TaxID=1396 RepID=A0A9W7PZ34_BACCE|nr:hypothetical protein [Bacillus cereus]KAA6448267.1 hypothetical protein DX932_31650 [Bacillus cereus]PFJ23929.1 hypothetical protein COI92_26955 [Bacillus anthracis]PGW01275.1 hypothetical protein COD87_27690 [Bacillus cereus]
MLEEQINLFDEQCIYEICDISKGNIKFTNIKKKFIELKVKVPMLAKSLSELEPSTDYDEEYELYLEYVQGIWLFYHSRDNTFSYEQAEIKCKESRDNQSEILIRVYLQSDNQFIPTNVLEYL